MIPRAGTLGLAGGLTKVLGAEYNPEPGRPKHGLGGNSEAAQGTRGAGLSDLDLATIVTDCCRAELPSAQDPVADLTGPGEVVAELPSLEGPGEIVRTVAIIGEGMPLAAATETDLGTVATGVLDREYRGDDRDLTDP